jgi:transaldolase/glucose-6-phosphate isomerase
MAHLDVLVQQGQSAWLNYLRRAFIDSGELKDALNAGISGITSSPLIFAKAISNSADYDKAIQALVSQGMPVKEIYESLVADDIQRAADVLHTIFDLSEGLDGYVTLELNPSLAHDATGTVAETRHILHEVNRPNAMIEVPATEAGITALEKLINDGVNVNATHIFSLVTYKRVAKAYLLGIETYIHSHSVWRQNPTSVASLSLSKIDHVVDQAVDKLGRPDLKGRTAVAMAKVAYDIFHQLFSGTSWQRLARRGALPQRLKWTRTTPLNFEYLDTFYVDELVGENTVVTLSPTTMNAFLDHGRVSSNLTIGVDEAKAHLTELGNLGLDLEAIGKDLQKESLAAFDKYFQELIQSVIAKRDQLDYGWRRMEINLGPYEDEIDQALIKFCDDRIMCRIWARDHSVWKKEADGISDRLGWMHVVETMQENRRRHRKFASSLQSGFRQTGPLQHAVILGMGGSSLAAEVFIDVFTSWKRMGALANAAPEVTVLDTIDPDTILTLKERLDLASTLFIVSSKSGETVETLSTFKYFYGLVLDKFGSDHAGDHFAAITDPGTKLAKIAAKFDFRDIFFNDPTIGGRYSALSYFGLVPAALVGVNLAKLLDGAFSMVCNAHSCNCPENGDNLAAQFGTIMGKMALLGRDKLTLIASPSIASFADWAEQLVAESTGKEGKGILPVVGEPIGEPNSYGQDRLFVYMRMDGEGVFDQEIDALIKASFPVITLNLKDSYDLGGLFFMWEMATAVAGYFLKIQPFDQPDVEEAKAISRSIIKEYRETGALPAEEHDPPTAKALHKFLTQVQATDYIALLTYLEPTAETDAALQSLRTSLRDNFKVATTVGYGPRYLHSTGQLHKGGAGNGFFILLTSDPTLDISIPTEVGKPESEITFGVLKNAQALGDAAALKKHGRRLIHFHFDNQIQAGFDQLTGAQDHLKAKADSQNS